MFLQKKQLTLTSLFLLTLGCVNVSTSVQAQTSTDSNASPALATPTLEALPEEETTEDKIDDFLHKFGMALRRRLPKVAQPTEQDKAVLAARQGQYSAALTTLDRLYQQNKNNQSVTRDYATVLAWAEQDQSAVGLYETLPPQQPDFVLAAMGHSYRKMNQTDKALAVYRQGLQQYPDSAIFAEGEIRCMADKDDLDNALEKANEDLVHHGNRPEIVAVKEDVAQAIVRREDDKAVQLARANHYPEALAILGNLHAQRADDVNVTRDYLAVLGWSGGQDQQVADLYKTLPASDEPDYVLEAAGHAYRTINQPDQAILIYQQGLQKYPDSVIFAEGEIRCLVDQKKYDEALTKADENIHTHGSRPEIEDIRKNILRLKKEAHQKAEASAHHKKSKHHN